MNLRFFDIPSRRLLKIDLFGLTTAWTRESSSATLGAMTLDFDSVETRDIVKVFGATRALSGIGVCFKIGTLTSIEGPNGSGKSTLLSLLALSVPPTSGQIHFGAYDLTHRAQLRGSIGLLAHFAMVYPDLTGVENLALFARLYKVPFPERRIVAMRDRFALCDWCQRPARTYSRGQLQRLALARALLHGPRLLLLDEPTTGLDETATECLLAALIEERQRGAIIVMATHDRAFADRLSDRQLRLQRGRLLEPI